MQSRPGEYIDTANRFALIVPQGWKLVEPGRMAVDTSVRTDWRLAATLISEAAQPAPTVTINAMHRVWMMPRDVHGIAEIERWIRTTWGNQVDLELNTEMSTVDDLVSFHTSILASMPGGRRMTLDQHLVPVVNQSYAIVAALDGERREMTARAALAVAQGFRVFKGWE
jgi:hypothetical protein